MAENKKKEGAYGAMLRSALLAWLISAAVLLLLAALLVEKGAVPYWAVGYLSSIMSFLTAAMAGAAMRRSGKGVLINALSVSVCLVILLLTVGFLASQGGLEPAGILSVSSFSITGFLCGNLLLGGRASRSKTGIATIKRK